MVALQCAGVARASVPVGVTHVVVPCYNEEKRLPIQKFLQFTSDEVCLCFARPPARLLEPYRESGSRRTCLPGVARRAPAVTRRAGCERSRRKTRACFSRLSTTGAPTRRSWSWRISPRSVRTGSRCSLSWAWCLGGLPCVTVMPLARRVRLVQRLLARLVGLLECKSWRRRDKRAHACAHRAGAPP
jgi:hypothetical protein